MFVGLFVGGRGFDALALTLFTQPIATRCTEPERVAARDQRCEPPQVLSDGGQNKLILGAAWATQSQSTEPQDALQVREPHLDLLALMSRLFKTLGAGERPGNVPGVLMDVARDLVGWLGALLGDSVVIGKPGDLIFKPREQWHTFWNGGDAPARRLEIISPAGFENYFRDLGAELLSGAPDPSRLAALCASYELDMDISSVPSLIQRFGVRFPGAPASGEH